jgi:hypothetical protein
MPRLHRREEETLDLASLGHEVEGWWGVKAQSKLITQQLNAGKERLLKMVQRHGEVEPEKGSLFLELDEPVSDRKITKLKAQRAEVPGINEEVCERILREKGLWDEMIEWVPRLDEGKVHAAYFDRKITKSELDRMFPSKVHFTLILLDDEDKPVN